MGQIGRIRSRDIQTVINKRKYGYVFPNGFLASSFLGNYILVVYQQYIYFKLHHIFL